MSPPAELPSRNPPLTIGICPKKAFASIRWRRKQSFATGRPTCHQKNEEMFGTAAKTSASSPATTPGNFIWSSTVSSKWKNWTRRRNPRYKRSRNSLVYERNQSETTVSYYTHWIFRFSPLPRQNGKKGRKRYKVTLPNRLPGIYPVQWHNHNSRIGDTGTWRTSIHFGAKTRERVSIPLLTENWKQWSMLCSSHNFQQTK